MANTRRTDYPEFIGFRVSKETVQALKTAAEREGRTISDIVRQAVRHDIDSRSASPAACPANHSLAT